MPAQGFFGPSNIVITGGTFSQINQSHPDTGFTTLSEKIARGAMYDSAERYSAGRCHPGTREEILNSIINWVNDPDSQQSVLWLWGPAGAGKSSILQTVSKLLFDSYRPRYAASFFFAKGVPGRGECGSLFSTLAYQLACNVDGMREGVNEAMTLDPLLPSKNIATQLHSLIVQPLLDLPSMPIHTPTVIIDGLDECHGSDNQRAILTLIRNSLTASRPVPLRFIIASRPEHAIRDEFDGPVLAGLTERIELSHSRQTIQDIRKYLQDGFDEIYKKNRDVMGDVAKPWPPEDRVNMFVRNASGQFIYASTVLSFIGSYSDFSDPQAQLELISKPGQARAHALSPLDHLYITILSTYPRRRELMRVLGGLFIKANVRTIVRYLDVSAGELKMVLRAMSSLVKHPRSQVNIDNLELERVFGPVDQDPIVFAHLSFRDFLQDKTRSGEFSINAKELYLNLYDRFMDTFISQLRNTDEDRSQPAVSPKIVIPITYDGYWGGYSFSIIAKNTPALTVIKHLDSLQGAMDAFPLVCNKMTASHLEDILPPLYAVHKFVASLGKDNQNYLNTNQNQLVSHISQAIDLCLRHTISVERFIQVPSTPIFILGGGGCMTLETIVQCLDVTEAQAVQFLKDNRHLIESDVKLVHYRAKKLDILTRDYMSVQQLVGFLMDQKRSGGLHRLFREAAIKTWRNLVVRLVRESKRPLDEEMHCFISTFLEKKAFIRLLNEADMRFMLPLYTDLSELDWSTLDVFEGGKDTFLTALEILSFLHDTTKKPKSATFLTPTLRCAVSTTMDKIFEAIILRPTSISYFSVTPLLSDDITGIPPYNINPADDEHFKDYESVLTDSLDEIKKILRVQDQEADSAQGGNNVERVLVCTSILEFLLRFWATKFFRESVWPIGRIVGLRCRFLFEYASSSEKIRLALWTLRDLDSKCRLQPNLPMSIVGSAREFIVRNQRHMDPENDLVSWLDELRGRSLARKETYPDSDDPSDMESMEDDESDVTDVNHEDDHGYEIEENNEQERWHGEPEQDLDSIYDWGD